MQQDTTPPNMDKQQPPQLSQPLQLPGILDLLQLVMRQPPGTLTIPLNHTRLCWHLWEVTPPPPRTLLTPLLPPNRPLAAPHCLNHHNISDRLPASRG